MDSNNPTLQEAWALEKYFVEDYDAHEVAAKKVLPDDLYKELYVNKSEYPIGLGKHPERGYFVLGSGQGPFIIWSEWTAKERLFHFRKTRLGKTYEGFFVATLGEIQAAQDKVAVIGTAEFGVEEFPINQRDFEPLTDDEDFIQKAKLYGLIPTGLNPLQMIPKKEKREDW